MRFAVIDLEGSTLDLFETRVAVRTALRAWVHADPALGKELSVIEYKDEKRVGPPVSASQFLSRKRMHMPRQKRVPFRTHSAVESLPRPKIEVEVGGMTVVGRGEEPIGISTGRGTLPRPGRRRVQRDLVAGRS